MQTYTNHLGQLVFTSQYHRARGHCCESLCLHCPYEFTLKHLPPKLGRKASLSELKKRNLQGDFNWVLLKDYLAGLWDGEQFIAEAYFEDQSIEKYLIPNA